jgi:hypothetical protein
MIHHPASIGKSFRVTDWTRQVDMPYGDGKDSRSRSNANILDKIMTERSVSLLSKVQSKEKLENISTLIKGMDPAVKMAL